MPTATGMRCLATPDDRSEFNRWRLGFFIVLACIILIALAAFSQQPAAKVSIRPTGPLPGINIP